MKNRVKTKFSDFCQFTTTIIEFGERRSLKIFTVLSSKSVSLLFVRQMFYQKKKIY